VLHTCIPRTRRDILGYLYEYFDWFTVILISLYWTFTWIMPIPLHCQLRPASRASLAAGLNGPSIEQGTSTYDLYVRNTVTTLVIYPVTLCIMFTSVVKFTL
jgi:hypothetical protein